jgi:hypothetical protein
MENKEKYHIFLKEIDKASNYSWACNADIKLVTDILDELIGLNLEWYEICERINKYDIFLGDEHEHIFRDALFKSGYC